MDERELLRVQATLEGHAAIARRIGPKVAVSEMELIALCNLASLGAYAVLSDLDGEEGDLCRAAGALLREDIEREFAGAGGLDGLVECVVAILGEQRLGQYVAQPPEENRSGHDVDIWGDDSPTRSTPLPEEQEQ